MLKLEFILHRPVGIATSYQHTRRKVTLHPFRWYHVCRIWEWVILYCL